ncbi:alpha/beta fold hydrolase [Nonomuraea phyllanthi]|uniref:Alpha/beta fold hydrolase n=1 Tax=Nonomuraea phyllanthi TaxID=2219224 RepID=A0A5C4VDM1_9ACTN|nr:alpha/beta hydrolase [Nonomuraea phyllanthi]KAB8191304.1 alpha/beta fold hydrolase [Nonomuraea phyllanthi]QFY12637.1 alpha/beta fold hydrolase [Nonomuraea phyllanthi]
MTAEPVPHWPGRMIGSVHVRSTGQGPGEQAVFVHGLAGSATNWTDLMDELKDTVTGHAIDLPGAGFSPAPADGDYSVAGHARAVIGLMEHTGPAHLFGNSLGGAVAVRVAAGRPDLVRSLTLVSPALPDLLPRYGPARVAAAALPVLGEWMANRLRLVPAEYRVNASMAMVWADAAGLHPVRLRDAVDELRRRDDLPHSATAVTGSARGIVAEYFRRGERNLWRQAAKVKAPALIVHGRHDRLVRPAMAAKAYRTFPQVRLVLLPTAGHVAMMEMPQVVAAEARRLIGETRLGNAPLAS